MNRLLLVAALLGFLSVAIGAAAEHALRPGLDEETWRWVMTAIRYHQVGALAALAVSLATWIELPAKGTRRLAIAGWLFIAGTVLFSFSIYAAALTGIDGLTFVTPFGGTTLMLAWLAVGWAALARRDG
ncbi:DUF423 domain-containing protein [Wenzhouxiangella sp. XN79A]|uniref:DUF423 domain-containing protein n=1 Tax=Wenzhouxiangella sp. XN79A TaxID=2724193 RepID=UPI00144AF8A0|nr:DUF423 domain-containing protein [Wenzhouxiangella sp. XN79A]NKI35216.1 DUF423 domain-containing protein [Wenzhouxiangella sp. XN79A]